ncbi:MAG: sulfatase [Planctomycetota bacterium]|nr:sulfatase [Planctomycetota bacterium]
MYRSRLVWLVLAIPLSVAAGAHAADRPARPNVVLLLVDDLGWQDLKCYDIDEPSPMETPNLDAFATRGVMFWQAYSPAPVCSPSRAAILSGLHPARGEMTSVAGGDPPCPASPHAPIIAPYNTARMPTARFTLAEALKQEGYATGHSGKWHIARNHYDFPNPFDHGFDVSCHDRGVQVPMKPDRLTGFATHDKDDPFRLDANGFPTDAPQTAALDFLRMNKDRPFFLYYATWLVHAPIVMRSEPLLRKYERKLGVTLTEEHATSWTQPGQTNPFYCAMVEQLDYYMGQIFEFLEATPDPRWPGHMLADNTFVIFTSDNGGMEGTSAEIYTDNAPLDRGKISLHEGGTRVPLIIAGPGIPRNVQTQVMANGLDIYPTILSLIGATPPPNKQFDGSDLAPLLTTDPTDPSLVKDAAGKPRDTLFWHFPHSENSSAIRVGDHKLFRRYRDTSWTSAVYRLTDSGSGRPRRADIEERHDLAAESPELRDRLDARLSALIEASGGRRPHGNPNARRPLPHRHEAPTILAHERTGRQLRIGYRRNGADLAAADIIYSPNGGREWLRLPAEIRDEATVTAELPPDATHYFINLIDTNNFLVIDPPVDRRTLEQKGLTFSDLAHRAGSP